MAAGVLVTRGGSVIVVIHVRWPRICGGICPTFGLKPAHYRGSPRSRVARCAAVMIEYPFASVTCIFRTPEPFGPSHFEFSNPTFRSNHSAGPSHFAHLHSINFQI